MNAISPFRVTEPGIYDLPSEQYHADPCPTPSLSAGMINDILAAPAKCREKSIRLNPNWEPEEGQDKFTIGTVSHVMHLEPHLFDEKVIVCPYDDWRSGAAKAMRDTARDLGKTPILEKHMVKVRAAREVFLAHAFTRQAFANGKPEQCLFWQHPRLGFWCRARPDFIADSRAHLCDYKATASADPEQFGRHAFSMGYHRRAAWYLDGMREVFGETPSHYWFCNQETKPPYLASVVELDMQSLEAGRLENDRAADLFAHCLETDDWPGYRHRDAPEKDLAFQVGLPSWALMQIDGRI